MGKRRINFLQFYCVYIFPVSINHGQATWNR